MDGRKWIVKKMSNNVKRWVLVNSRSRSRSKSKSPSKITGQFIITLSYSKKADKYNKWIENWNKDPMTLNRCSKCYR